MTTSMPRRTRPLSPKIQTYRPQLTSVLSIANRVTGIASSLYAVVLAVWLVAAADGPHAYATVQVVIQSWVGQLLLFGSAFSFFLHLCGGIHHLVWDAGHGFRRQRITVRVMTLDAARMPSGCTGR